MSHAPYEPIPQAPPQWAQQPVAQRAPSRLLPILGVVLGSLGLVAGVGAWFRAAPSHEGAAAVYSEQEVSEAKAAVCEAYGRSLQAIRTAGTKPIDPQNWLPVAVNTRLAEVATSNTLINSLAAHPAASPELRQEIAKLAYSYQDMALIQLADGRLPDYQRQTNSADEAIAKIDELCR